jgi:hypothetical protein
MNSEPSEMKAIQSTKNSSGLHPKGLKTILFGVTVLLLTCLVVGSIMVSIQLYARSGYTQGYNAELCAGFIMTPTFKIGFYWSLPIFSYTPVLATAKTHFCIYVPYPWIQPLLSWLPREIMVPP